jgi:transcriptional regulator with GAF, ATPase, and Fis domain
MFVGALVIGSRLEPRSPGWQAVWVGLTAWLLLLGLDLVRWRLRQAMGRLLHREKYQLDRTLRRVSEVVGRQVDPPALCRQFMQALGDLVAIPQGGIYLRSGDPARYRLTASLGAPPPLEELPAGAPLLEALAAAPLVQLDLGPGRGGTPAQRQLAELQGAVAVALRHEGALLAVLVIGPRRLGAYEAEALHLLTTLAPITALALHGAAGHQTIDTLNRDLQTKVEKISELQRRITTLQGQLLRARVADGEAPPAAGAAAVPAGVVGSGPAVQRLLDTVRKVAGSSSAVLIRGESGTGKELLARALHAQSPRAAGPLVTVHCAALSPTLLESELFGHVKGAFTGAAKDKPGRFELAHGGTLFLDEIGDISPDVQTKLLRVLQERTFERVGSNEPIRVDVRLIAATHQDLERLIREGKFREDLFYRLNVITIRTPPLRERREDLYELALHFLRQHSQRCHKELTGIDDEALEALKAHDWPGNVRELENAIERAVVLSDGPSLTLRDLPEEVQRGPQARTPVPRSVPVPQPAWEADLDRREYDRLMQALAAANGNKARAARALGLPRTTFLSKLEKYGVGPRRG